MNSLACPSPEGLSASIVERLNRRSELVLLVREGDARGMTDLYDFISAGLHPYLARQLPPQDCRDKIHSIFVDVVVAIQRGQVRDPERLMGFARTIARRKVPHTSAWPWRLAVIRWILNRYSGWRAHRHLPKAK